jgi:hypothetical protein
MDGIMLNTPDQIAFAQLAARKGALKLEVNTGMKMNRGVNILKVCKEAYGLKGNKQQVLAQMEALVEACLNPPTYDCGICGETTVDNGADHNGCELCEYCYEECTLENELNDGYINQEEHDERLKALKVKYNK